jgi:hypothetical protein
MGWLMEGAQGTGRGADGAGSRNDYWSWTELFELYPCIETNYLHIYLLPENLACALIFGFVPG